MVDLRRFIPIHHVHHIRLEDVVRDLDADFLEAVDVIVLNNGRLRVTVDQELRDRLEDYLNALHRGRPFLFFRDDLLESHENHRTTAPTSVATSFRAP